VKTGTTESSIKNIGGALTDIDFMKHVWRFLEVFKPLSRPGWWTLKRWVELMWSRQNSRVPREMRP
jgi:hypothetical protein